MPVQIPATTLSPPSSFQARVAKCTFTSHSPSSPPSVSARSTSTLKPASLSIHFRSPPLPLHGGVHLRVDTSAGRYHVSALFSPPPRLPVACSHPRSPVAGPEHRKGCYSSSAWGGAVMLLSPSCFFGFGSESLFPSPTPMAPEGGPRKRSVHPDRRRSAPRSLRCGLWSWTRICAYGALWERLGRMRMGPPQSWKGGAGQTNPRRGHVA